MIVTVDGNLRVAKVTKEYDIHPDDVRGLKDTGTTQRYYLHEIIRTLFYGLDHIDRVFVANMSTDVLVEWTDINGNDVRELSVFSEHVLNTVCELVGENQKDVSTERVAKELIANGASTKSIIGFIKDCGYAAWFADMWHSEIAKETNTNE